MSWEDVERDLAELDLVLSRLRIVSSGDIITSDDHNDLVMALRKVRDILSRLARAPQALKLSLLEIDADKNWEGRTIYNLVIALHRSYNILDADKDLKLGCPVLSPGLPEINIKLLRPDEQMFAPFPFDYEIVDDEGYLAVMYKSSAGHSVGHITRALYPDKGLKCRVYLPYACAGLIARVTDNYDYYAFDACAWSYPAIWKYINGWWYLLARMDTACYEGWYIMVMSCWGTTIKGSIDGGETFITATDADIATGRWGFEALGFTPEEAGIYRPIEFGSPYSRPLKPAMYLEVPVTGSGTRDDPFRPDISRYRGVCYSAFIPSDRSGRPQPTSIVRVFRVPSDDVATELRSRYRALSRDEAVKAVLAMDDRISIEDLVQFKPDEAKKRARDYAKHRESLKAEIDEKDAERYIAEDKGW